MLPESKYGPSSRLQSSIRILVSYNISRDLCRPILRVVIEGFVAMLGTTVPEASIGEDHNARLVLEEPRLCQRQLKLDHFLAIKINQLRFHQGSPGSWPKLSCRAAVSIQLPPTNYFLTSSSNVGSGRKLSRRFRGGFQQSMQHKLSLWRSCGHRLVGCIRVRAVGRSRPNVNSS